MFSFLKILLCLFTINVISSGSDAYRILVISPANLKSHNNLFESIEKALVKKGHQVDVITHFELKNQPKNYKTIINLDGTMQKLVHAWNMEMVAYYRKADVVSTIVNEFGNNFCELLSVERMQKFIKNPPKYDLVITEAFGADCFFGFGYILKVPVVAVSAMTEFLWHNEILGNPLSTAFAINIDSKSAQISTFWERFKSTFWARYNNYRFFKYTNKNQTEAMRKYLSPDIPNIREIEKKLALLLVNSYQSMYGIKPNTPAVVQIAGIHIEQSEIKLTPDLQIWMDEADHGVVFFTLGSMVILEDFSKEILLGLYASFAKLAPIRFLVKIADKRKLPPGLPDNVLTMPWIPQIAILRHKNTRIFMTHGGLNSVQEALYFGVPMIGFPLYADQELNIKVLAAKNVCYEMDYEKISEKSVDKALHIVLNDLKYREAAKRESRVFRDRPMSASETAVFWIEYVIRNGANSLRSPAMNLKWWQIELLDVYGFFLSCFLIMILIVLVIIKSIISNFRPSKSQRHRKKD